MKRGAHLRLTPRRSRLLRINAELEPWRAVEAAGDMVLSRPPKGWIRHLREALNMSGGQLAYRLGVRQPTVARFEQNERADNITLRTLRRVGDALGCDLVYALVPRRPLTEVVERQVHYAACLAARAGVANEAELEDVVRELLVRQPGWIWGSYENAELLQYAPDPDTWRRSAKPGSAI